MTLTSDRSSGLILITGFIAFVVGAAVAPSGAYQGAIPDRLAVIAANEGQWVLSKAFDGLAVVLGTGGFVLLSLGASRRAGSWLNTVGGVSFTLAGIVGIAYVYLLAADPGPLYDRSSPAPVVVGLLTLMALGLLASGFRFRQAGYPGWMGWLGVTVGAGVIVAEAMIFLLALGPEAAFGLAFFMYVAIIAIGASLARHGGPRAAPALPAQR